jgi:hypothetical protein
VKGTYPAVEKAHDNIDKTMVRTEGVEKRNATRGIGTIMKYERRE